MYTHGHGQRYFHHHHHGRDDGRDRDRHPPARERNNDARDDGDWFQGLVRTGSRRDSTDPPAPWAERARDGRSPQPARGQPFPGEVPPRITDDGEAVSALDLVRNASGTRGQHGRELSTTILRTLTRRGWVFAREPFSGDRTPSSVVQANDLADFLLAAANVISGSPYSRRLVCYCETPGFAALVERVQRARNNQRRPAPESPHAHHGPPLCAVKLEPVKLEPVKAEPVDMDDPAERHPIRDRDVQDNARAASTDATATAEAAVARGAHSMDIANDRADDAHALQLDAESERAHDAAVLDRLADRAHIDRPLCVWECRGGMWRLVFAARPGTHPRRPWRIVAGSTEPPDSGGRDAVVETGPLWIDRAAMVERARAWMASPAGVVAVAPGLDCEPPPAAFCFAQGADALAFGNMWLSETARQCVARTPEEPPRDRDLMARLAVRLARAAVAGSDVPYGAECRGLVDALLYNATH
ncbi:hypothetical protein pdul_cds_25 [Pandoravirus dulcis]|uniref:Uncharacterized protein n=1 Tax=Pandoravirus dulcis TaxID=1349409 RepID=S4VRB2_9VIRU|nr:hypothetical protein pdul_cds_25 [Pandoravirus dulcis]AGO81900.1 hypothetical protein pdul_cds_25 [Pandoravirus dulcis]